MAIDGKMSSRAAEKRTLASFANFSFANVGSPCCCPPFVDGVVVFTRSPIEKLPLLLVLLLCMVERPVCASHSRLRYSIAYESSRQIHYSAPLIKKYWSPEKESHIPVASEWLALRRWASENA